MAEIVQQSVATEQLAAAHAEVLDWHEQYRKAWVSGDVATIATLTDLGLTGRMIMMDGQTAWEAEYEAEISGIRDFLSYAARNNVVSDFQVYDIAFRSLDEAIVVSRRSVRIPAGDDARRVTQFALETLRRGADGRWRLVRYWAEKARLLDEAEIKG